MFKPDEAACLLAERFNMIGWIYKQESIMFNRLASYFTDLNATNDKRHKAALSNVATVSNLVSVRIQYTNLESVVSGYWALTKQLRIWMHP